MTLPRGTVIVPTFEDPAPSVWQRPGDERTYTFDLSSILRTFWQAARAYAANDYVRSKGVPGFAFQAGGAGVSGPTEPPWPRVLAGTVVDGSITWTAVAPGSNGTDPISSVTWSLVNPPDGALSIPANSFATEECTAQLLGGTSQLVYLVQAQVTTTGGNQYRCQFNLEID